MVQTPNQAADKCAETDALSQYAEKARVEQAIRKSDIGKAVDEANLECQEAEKLRESIKELNATQGRNASELKLKLGNEESNISTMWAEIADTLEELALIQKQYDEHNERAYAENARVDKEIVKAKEAGDFVKGAFERAQKNSNEFSAMPDTELAAENKVLDETEKKIVDEAIRERAEIIEMEPLFGARKCRND